MVAQFVTDLESALSRDRLERYRPSGGSDLEMVTNYFWNIDLSEALVPCMHAVELALRNSIHSALSEHYDSDMWFYQPGVLDSGELGALSKALRKVSRKPPLLSGRLVAALSFGFWVSLLDARYEQQLWQPNGYALVRRVFPYSGTLSVRDISRRFNRILDLRNRAFHHEGIWHRPNLLQEHADIHEAIGWISPTLQQAILAVDNFVENFQRRPQVEADLKRHLGIP